LCGRNVYNCDARATARLVQVRHAAGRHELDEGKEMTAKQPPAGDLGSPAPTSRAALEQPLRRPYQAPRILFREPLEAMASICSPHPPAKANKGVCPMGPISS
jgi:hypothetical protein